MAAFFTELFRIDPSKIDSLLDPELERDPETSLWLRSLGDLELDGLWEALPDSESEGTLMGDLLSDEEAEQLVFGVPDGFVDGIETLSDEAVDEVVATWSQMDELAEWEGSDLAQVVRDIRGLVRAAKANDQIVVQLMEI